MLSQSTAEGAAGFAGAFAAAQPFRHVVIENFFAPEVARDLVRDFPAFRAENARNELGETGRKAVVQDLQSISPFYRQVGEYLASADFLRTISVVTGIPDLKYDRRMFGGGTHENLDGQELDPHVDFNMLHGWHRRLNVIVYLNEEWHDEWGGAIELHSDPRNPDHDRIQSILPAYNRAVIFETNEHSWHGFRKIVLPPDKRHLSRKSLSIYLYTADRPAAEKAPPHGTFYVSRPLPAHIVAGHTMTSADVAEVRELMQRRDKMIELLQREQLEASRKLAPFRRLFEIPLLGTAIRGGWGLMRRLSQHN